MPAGTDHAAAIRPFLLNSMHASELSGSARDPSLPVGIGLPRMVPAASVDEVLAALPPGGFAFGHLPHDPVTEQLFRARRAPIVLIVRDPRDVVVSHARYVGRIPHHRLYDLYRDLDPVRAIDLSIRGVGAGTGGGGLLDLAARVGSLLGWLPLPEVCLVRFEALVGPRGGGSADQQRDALRRIARHLGVEAGDAVLDRVAEASYGGTATFDTGRIGAWRQALSAAQTALIDDMIGPMLEQLGYARGS
jgi:hypothetical protein